MQYSNPLSMLQQALVSMPGGAPAPAAPSYYGPVHYGLTQALNNALNWQANRQDYVGMMLGRPDLVTMHGGLQSQAYTPPLPKIPLVDWFAGKPAAAVADANAAAALPAAIRGGLLMQPFYAGGSADGATGADGVGGVGAGVGTGVGDASAASNAGVGGNDGSSGVAW